MTDRTILKTLNDTFWGLTGSVVAVVSPIQEQFEWWVGAVGGVLGCMVAAVTLYRLITRKTV